MRHRQRPGELDQTECVDRENEEDSPWPAFHVEHGFEAEDSTATAFTMRSVAHIEARHTTVPEQLALDLVAGAAGVNASSCPRAATVDIDAVPWW